MKIGFLGSGNMAQAMGKIFLGAGHEVALSVSTDPAKLEEAAASLGVRALNAQAVADFADVVVLATTWGGAKFALDQAGPMEGKHLWSIVNPLKPDYSGLEVGTTTSGSEQILAWSPGVKLTAAWPPFAEILHKGPALFGTERPNAFMCGNDEEGKAMVAELLDVLGAIPIDAGQLYAARYIEPAMMLLVHLAYAQGMGTLGSKILSP